MNDNERILAIARKWWPERDVRDEEFYPQWCVDACWYDIPDFPHDWAATGLLLERVKEKGFVCQLRIGSHLSQAAITREFWQAAAWEKATTLPAAVCAAAEAIPQAEIDRALKVADE